MIGRVLMTETTKMNIPKPLVLGPMKGRGVLSGDVIALDSQTVMIKHLVFGGNQPDTYFMVGSGPRPGPFGVKIPDEEGSMNPLGSYKNRTIILTLPDSMDLMSLSWLAIWSHSLQSSFAEISIPRHLNIPPATRLIGVTPQVGFSIISIFPHLYRASSPNCTFISACIEFINSQQILIDHPITVE